MLLSRSAFMRKGSRAIVLLVAILIGVARFVPESGLGALGVWIEGYFSAASGLSVEPAAEGIVKSAREPFGLIADLVVILTCVVLVFSYINSWSLASPETTQEKVHDTARRIDQELHTIMGMVGSYIASNRTFSGALREAHKELTSNESGERLADAIRLLITENQRMLKETAGYQRSLRASQDKIAQLQFVLAKTKELTERDPLTSCYNRGAFDSRLESLLVEARTGGAPISLVIADVDHFKQINDKYGHLVGDEVLKVFANLLHGSVSKGDIVARYGGEEFAVILPGSTLKEAAATAERMRRWLGERNWVVRGVERMEKISASFGVAQWRPNETSAALIARADDNLYRSKAQGRDCVVFDV